jgi:hypothetical protein
MNNEDIPRYVDFGIGCGFLSLLFKRPQRPAAENSSSVNESETDPLATSQEDNQSKETDESLL